MATIEEVLTKVEVLSQAFYDFKELYSKDSSEIKTQVKRINGSLRDVMIQAATNKTLIKEHNAWITEIDNRSKANEKFILSLPVNKKWFWIVIATLLLPLIGKSLLDIVPLIQALL